MDFKTANSTTTVEKFEAQICLLSFYVKFFKWRELVEENHNNENSEGDLDVETEETNGVLHGPEPAEVHVATTSDSGESRSSHASILFYQDDTGNKSSSSLSGDSSDSENKQSGQVSENVSDESSSFSEEELDLPLYEGSDLSRKGFLSLFLTLSKLHGMSEKTKEDILYNI